jgi:hypothetical protein
MLTPGGRVTTIIGIITLVYFVTTKIKVNMRSIWYEFIDEYMEEIPYKPLSVILEAFYWYNQMIGSTDNAFIDNCHEKTNNLMK